MMGRTQSTTAIILAGGLGTRLRSAIGETPKSLAQIAGRPFLVYLLSYLARHCFRDVILSVGYKRKDVESVIGQSSQGISIRYSREEIPLGTGGALKRALSMVSSKYALVLNGDTFLKADYKDMIDHMQSSTCNILMALKRVEDCSRFGAVKARDGTVIGFMEKGMGGPGAINAGVYLVKQNLFDGYELARSFSFEREFLTPYVTQLHPCAYYSDGYFIDIGTASDYQRAQVEIPGELQVHDDECHSEL